VTSEALAGLPRSERAWARTRIGVALVAVALVAGVVAVLVWLIAPPAPVRPVRNPFGAGVREAVPSASALGSYILALQGSFFRNLQAAVAALKQSGAAFWSLMTIGFAYGVFHAAGPGHGKAIIAAYLVSSERALLKGLMLSLAAALVQALVAIGIVGAVAVALHATAATMSEVTNAVEITSFAAVAVLGAAITWRKAGKLVGVATARGPARAPEVEACDHVHLPPPKVLERVTNWREMAGIALAAGIRPCAGAIVVLVFALSQGLFAAGIAATLAMALGTALTTGAVAALAVFAKSAALRLADGRRTAGPLIIAGLELLAAAFVLVLGLSLLLGLWTASAAS
jgi:nickel/cobalt exporter